MRTHGACVEKLESARYFCSYAIILGRATSHDFNYDEKFIVVLRVKCFSVYENTMFILLDAPRAHSEALVYINYQEAYKSYIFVVTMSHYYLEATSSL